MQCNASFLVNGIKLFHKYCLVPGRISQIVFPILLIDGIYETLLNVFCLWTSHSLNTISSVLTCFFFRFCYLHSRFLCASLIFSLSVLGNSIILSLKLLL